MFLVCYIQIPTKSKIRSAYWRVPSTEAESKEKHGVWDPYAGVDCNLTSPYIHSRAESNTFTMGNPMPDST